MWYTELYLLRWQTFCYKLIAGRKRRLPSRRQDGALFAYSVRVQAGVCVQVCAPGHAYETHTTLNRATMKRIKK